MIKGLMGPTLDEVRELFQLHQLRCTRQREVVYAALAGTTGHPTAEELHSLVHAIEPGLSLATVYNTLEALTECGLARKLPGSGGCCRFDAVVSPHVHVTTRDGRLMDVPQDLSQRLMAGLSPELLRELEQRMGVAIEHLNVQVVAKSHN
ncbi:MAG TPA: transcriptional repressor [Phycisphaerales bacterium]|nr:transcriptional repressor [Phycisphaerales bacterium]